MLVRWLALLRVPRYTVFHRRLEKKSIRDSLLKVLGFQPHRVFQPSASRSRCLGVRPVVRQMKGEAWGQRLLGRGSCNPPRMYALFSSLPA
jgi:hypothetical protein